jgi:hypothetical protein
MTAKTTTAEYKDVINLQRVKQLFCKSDEEVSEYFNIIIKQIMMPPKEHRI